jgi:uroporphyrinogen decarboxylase
MKSSKSSESGPLHKDRVNKAISFEKPDRIPRDFAAVPEIWRKLGDYFGTEDRAEILKHMDVDCRIVSYDSFCCPPDIDPRHVNMNASQERSSVGGMWRNTLADGSNVDIWGAHRKKIKNPSGELEQFASFPLESATSVEDLSKYNWPQADWWDFSNLSSFIDTLNDSGIYNIRYRLGSFFETAWSLYNFEKFQLDLLLNPHMTQFVMDRIAEVHIQNLERVLELAGDQIDIVYFYDDEATQNNLLISPELYEESIQGYHQKVIDIAAKYGKPTMMHCCGAVYPLIETFIQMGLKILNPIQPSAANMNPEKLAEEFGGRIAFHGGIDVQQFLPAANPEEVEEKVNYTSEVLGSQGGYILSGSHHLQADIPLENVLAMYGII